MAVRHWLQLALTEGIGPVLSRRVIALAGNAEAASLASTALLQQVEGIGTAKAPKIAAALRKAASRVDEEMALAASMGVRIICPEDSDFPALLAIIPDPPIVLYVKGDLQPRDLNAVALVGSRKCSFYGREQAERLAASLAGVGITVVSGGARGIDSAAHRGALSHSMGRTIAVIGSGIDVPYPPENENLFDQISQRGAVISEFAMGTMPAKENFPRRNRLVSGISRGVLVIEADVKSGALITARQCGEDHGRPVMALPGRVDNPLSAGPHQLIRDGATLVTVVAEILDALDPLPDHVSEPALFDVESSALIEESGPPAPTANANLSLRQQQILDAFGSEESSIDAIIERTGLPARVVLQEATFLSLMGELKRIDGQTYSRRSRRK